MLMAPLDVSLPLRPTVPLHRRPCSAISAVGRTSNNDRDAPRKFDRDKPRFDRREAPWGSPAPGQAAGGRGPGRPVPGRSLPRQDPASNASQSSGGSDVRRFGYGGEPGGRFGRDSWADREGGPSVSKRDAKERAARKAARIAEKTAAAARNTQGSCYGCGAPLQTEVPQGPGYVAPDKYEVKKKHKQLDKVLCGRCSDLCNGAMIPAVQDFTQKLQLRQMMGMAPGDAPSAPQPTAATTSASATDMSKDAGAEALSLLGKVLVTPEQLRSQLTPLALRAAVVVLLVDLTDASGTLMSRVRDMVGRNPIILVGTKIDLLPEGCRPREVAEWLSGAAASKKLNVVSVHLVSSHTGEGMSAAVSRICRERKSRDVYVVGAANVGKSAFVRAMLKEMGRTEPVAIGTGKYLPVESAMPGTTLGLIPLKAFSSGGTLFDTPGVHLHHRIPHMLSPSELKLLHPRRPLTAYVPALPAELSGADDESADDDEAANGVRPLGGASAASAAGDSGASGPGGVRQGRGGLKLVDYEPTDEYGRPIRGLDAGVRREAAGRRAAADGPASHERTPLGWSRQQPAQLSSQPQRQAQATYMWSDLVRVDVLSGPPDTALVFYGPSTMRVVSLPYIRPDQRLEVEYETASSSSASSGGSSGALGHKQVLVCTESVAARGGLLPQELVVKATGTGSGNATADIAVSGLPGWVAVWAPRAKKDVRLRVWAPRGVDVMLRPAFPSPIPTALQRAWRGERRGGVDSEADEDEDEEAPELAELSRALVAGGVGDPTSDPQWWEAMAALKDEDLPGYGAASAAASLRRRRQGATAGKAAAGSAGDTADEDDDDDELPDWDDEAELLDDEDEEGGSGGERVIVSATVEDILRRPRLDVLAQMDLDVEDEDEGDEEDNEISSFTLTKAASRRRVMDGPENDGRWNPLAVEAKASAKAASAASSSSSRGSGGRQAASGLRRRPAAGRSSDLAAAVAEAEEAEEDGAWVEEDAEELSPPAGSVRRRPGLPRGSGGARLWLNRRRRAAGRVAAREDEREEGEVE